MKKSFEELKALFETENGLQEIEKLFDADSTVLDVVDKEYYNTFLSYIALFPRRDCGIRAFIKKAACKKGFAQYVDFDASSEEEFKMLTSYHAIISCETGKVKVADLKGLSEEEFNRLTSYNARELYKTEKVTFADLKSLSEQDFGRLTQHGVKEAYNTGKVTFADLKGLSYRQIESLVSYRAINLYQNGKANARDLKADTEEGIEYNIDYYRKGIFNAIISHPSYFLSSHKAHLLCGVAAVALCICAYKNPKVLSSTCNKMFEMARTR